MTSKTGLRLRVDDRGQLPGVPVFVKQQASAGYARNNHRSPLPHAVADWATQRHKRSCNKERANTSYWLATYASEATPKAWKKRTASSQRDISGGARTQDRQPTA
ncbi:hypothetical protein MCOR07_000517 [Pyricularia oryzae]|nr:hypothetical protein MCOR01_005536 [Pyricularia oryzae]KAI6630151.1 hypothetical protein MCOR07_000517 [Pyricularia oryzae]